MFFPCIFLWLQHFKYISNFLVIGIIGAWCIGLLHCFLQEQTIFFFFLYNYVFILEAFAVMYKCGRMAQMYSPCCCVLLGELNILLMDSIWLFLYFAPRDFGVLYELVNSFVFLEPFLRKLENHVLFSQEFLRYSRYYW